MPNPPLRACFVLSHFHPVASGAERQALAQGIELVRRGHQVHVVTQHVEGQPSDEILGGVEVHRWVRPSTRGPAFGITFVAGVIAALRRLRPRYDVIHTYQGLWESISTGLGRPWLRDAPTLIQPACSGYFGEAVESGRTRGAPVLRRLMRNNSAFAATSSDIEREWRDLVRVPERKLLRLAYGLDADHFRPGPADPEVGATLPPGPRIAFTGRLHPQKNLDLLLDAWPAVAARTSAQLVLIGQGPDCDRLLGRARDLGISDRVHLPGAVADPAAWLRASDAFVLPSVAEGMSNSLLEAMATALPRLASAIGGNTDLLENGRTGLLLPLDQTSAWSEAIIRVVEDVPFARSLGQAARLRVEQEYAMNVTIDRLEALYRLLLAGQSPRAGHQSASASDPPAGTMVVGSPGEDARAAR